MVQGAGCLMQGVGCRAQGAGSRVQGAGCWVQAGYRVQVLGAGCSHATVACKSNRSIFESRCPHKAVNFSSESESKIFLVLQNSRKTFKYGSIRVLADRGVEGAGSRAQSPVRESPACVCQHREGLVSRLIFNPARWCQNKPPWNAPGR